ncbi:hypothetical protein [Chiayiivirga flava]|uniref:Uncharacterized protein n=1 Tax=Chiayiivirga flava TaxID=659595 RepID=A0A7W8D8M4_9GAMM|nr:hypothetical protein [Chiayiivirga flava]MBB5208802.1 hypothetical protein [Chiayiivirga flava]
MKIRIRTALVALSFLFALGSGVAFAAGNTACLKSCSLDQAACLSDAVGSGKAACVAQYTACKKSCGA